MARIATQRPHHTLQISGGLTPGAGVGHSPSRRAWQQHRSTSPPPPQHARGAKGK